MSEPHRPLRPARSPRNKTVSMQLCREDYCDLRDFAASCGRSVSELLYDWYQPELKRVRQWATARRKMLEAG